MKSNELFEEIHSGRIEEGTKIDVVNELTGGYITEIEYKNQRLNWTSGEFDTSFLCNIDIEFVIQENKEIEELKISESDRKVMATFVINNREKINELVREVNKMKKESK